MIKQLFSVLDLFLLFLILIAANLDIKFEQKQDNELSFEKLSAVSRKKNSKIIFSYIYDFMEQYMHYLQYIHYGLFFFFLIYFITSWSPFLNFSCLRK